jgi:HAD superfamily hydrolase (TIGR01490 family)
MIEHFKKLVKYEVIDPRLWHSNVKYTFKEWRKRVRDYEDYMLELIDIYVDSLRGRRKDDLEFISNQVIKLNGEIVYRYTRDRIAWHQQEGHRVFFISGSPNFLVSKMAEKYGVDAYRGAHYLTDDRGYFTGEVVPMWDAASKEKAMETLREEFQLDLTRSYAYGDTRGDISMLEKTGYPVAINPTRELVEYLKQDEELRRRAQIVVERKDVVYRLDPGVEVLE